MLETDGLKISVSQGDTGTISVTFTGQDIPPDGTIAKVILQKTQDSVEPLWEKLITVEGGRIAIPLFTEDTDYPYGLFCWCLRLLYENGDVYTPMEKPQAFRILPAGGNMAGGDACGS